MDELTDKLKDKRPVCWSLVSEKLGKQPVIDHSEAHPYVIEYILDKRYSELRQFRRSNGFQLHKACWRN